MFIDCFSQQRSRTLLHHACETGDVELCQVLLDAKVNVNIQDEVQSYCLYKRPTHIPCT